MVQASHDILEVSAKYKLYLYPEKCEFNRQKIKYLGLVISENYVKIDSIKIASICDWPIPWSRTDI